MSEFPEVVRPPAGDSNMRWQLMRWQLAFRDETAPLEGWNVDATTTPEGEAWADQITGALLDRGVQVSRGFDDGEDGQGNEVTYLELYVQVGEEQMALAFWRHEIAWTTDAIIPREGQAAFVETARAVMDAVTRSTPWRLDARTVSPADRDILGIAE